MIKLIAFDWNGTLIADTSMAVKAESVALNAVGEKSINLKTFQEHFQIPIIKYWESFGYSKSWLNKNINTIEQAFHTTYETLVNQARSRSGTKPLLNWLKQQNISAIIYSNHNVPNIERHLHRWKVFSLVNTTLARSLNDHSHLHSRGKQQKLHDYVLANKFKPHEVISVGDTEEEIEIGKALGYHTVAITGGYNTTARLKKHNPDFLIHNMKELVGIIKKLNR